MKYRAYSANVGARTDYRLAQDAIRYPEEALFWARWNDTRRREAAEKASRSRKAARNRVRRKIRRDWGFE